MSRQSGDKLDEGTISQLTVKMWTYLTRFVNVSYTELRIRNSEKSEVETLQLPFGLIT